MRLSRSVSNCLASKSVWRADCFQSIARRSSPGMKRTNDSNSLPSPSRALSRWPICASRANRRAPSSRTARIEGTMAISRSMAIWRCLRAKPKGPLQPSHAAVMRASPRFAGVRARLAVTSPSVASSEASRRPPGAISGSASSAMRAAGGRPTPRVSTVRPSMKLSPTPTAGGAETASRALPSGAAANASKKNSPIPRPAHAAAAHHSSGRARPSPSASGAPMATKAMARPVGAIMA